MQIDFFYHIAKFLWAKYNDISYEPSGPKLVHPDKTLKTLSALTHNNKFVEAYNSIPEEEKEGGIDMCRVVNEIENRGMDRGVDRGVDIAASVVLAFQSNGSVSETAKMNHLSEEKTASILKRFHLLPV